MPDGLPPLATRLSLVGAADFSRDMDMVRGAIDKGLGAFKKGEEGAKKLGKEFDNLGSKFERFTDSIVTHAKTIQTVFLTLSTGGALTGVLKNVGDLDKKMFGLSKSAAMTGQSFGAMTRGIADLNAATLLSIADSTEFFKVVSEGTKGVRMTADQVSKLGKTLSDEFGPSIDDVTQAFQKLAQIQEKDVFLFRKIHDGMDADKLGAYTARLIVLNKVSEDQLNTLFRTVYARELGEKAQSVEQRRMMEYTKIVQEFNKLFQDLVLNIGKELMPTFKSLIPHIKTAAEYLKNVIDKHPGLVKIVGTMAMFGSTAGGAGRILQGGASIASTGMQGASAALTAMRGTRANPMIVKSVDGVGTTGGPGAGLVATLGKALGIAGLAYAAGAAGKQVGDAVGGQAGAGIRSGSKVAEYAGYGAAGGSLFAGVGAIPGAILGGIAGLIASIDDLEEAFTGSTDEETKRISAEYDEMNKKTKAEAEKGRTERLIKAESDAGIGMDETRFGTALMSSRVVKKRLIAGGMSESDAKDEAEDAGRGQASSRWLKEQRKIGIADLQPDMAATRKEIGSLIPDDDKDKVKKVDEQFEEMPKKLELIKKQSETLSLRNFVIEAEQINELLGSITGSLKDQTALELEFYGNAEKAQENIAKTIEYERQAVRLLTQKRDQTLEMIDAHGGLEAAQARALVLQEKGAAITSKEKRELESILGSTAALEIQDKALVGHKREILTQEQSRSSIYDQRLAVQESELSLMESQAAMVKEMYLGAGPTLEFQMKEVQLLEKMKNINAANLKNAQADLQTYPDRVDLQQKVNVLQQKQYDWTRKQLSLTKNLREGYLDSMTSMTNAEGHFAKFVLRKDMGAAEMQRNFLAAGGMRSGMVGAGATGPTMRWKPGGGPGALQYMDPDSLKRLGSTYNEEFGPPQQIHANMANALAQTPFGQFGAQAPENGASSMGGRGAGITIQNPQQAAELQNIQRDMEAAIKKGEGTQDLQARAETILKSAEAGTFEGQIVAKMDQIIGIMSGTKPVQDTKTTEAVAEGVEKGQAAVAEKGEQKGRQEATKQAADMRRGTLEKGAPSVAEAAIKKQSDQLDESERLAQAKFDAYAKTLGDWNTVAAGVNTKFLGIGKQGGGGAAGVQHEGAKGKGMTPTGLEKDFTAEQIKAASKGPGAGAAGEAQREINIDDIAAQAGKIQSFFEKPDADMEAQIEAQQVVQSIEKGKQAKLAEQLVEERGFEEVFSVKAALIEPAAESAKGGGVLERSRNLEAEKEKLLKQFSAESVSQQKGLGGSGVVGMGEYVLQGLAQGARKSKKRVGMMGDAVSGGAKAVFGKLIGEQETEDAGAQQFGKAGRDIYGELTKGEEKPEKSGLTTNQEAIYETIKEISRRQKEMEPEVKAAKEAAEAADKQETLRLAYLTEANTRAGNVAQLEKEMESSKKTSKDAASNQADLEKQQADIAGQKAAAYAQLLGLTEDQGKQMTEQESNMKESKISFEGTELQKSQTEYSREMDELTKGIEKRRRMVELLTPMKGDSAADKQIEENKTAITEMTKKRNALTAKGDASGMPYADGNSAGLSLGPMPDSKNEFAQWQKSAEALKKLTEEGNQIAKDVGKENVDASKAVGQNLTSSLEQQKMDVTPVVTTVDSGVMQAADSGVMQTAASGGWIARMAGGGKLPGFGGGDRVLAMLEPGEFVVNKNAAKAFPALLDSINKNRYANGGTVGMLPSPAMARAGGTIMPRFNISVRGDTAKTLVDSVGSQLSGLLNDMFTPQGTSGRLYDLGS